MLQIESMAAWYVIFWSIFDFFVDVINMKFTLVFSITARHSGLKGILSVMCKDENNCLQDKPEEIDIEEWQHLISYLGSEKLNVKK